MTTPVLSAGQEVAITLFRLKADLTPDDYRAFSRETVRSGMLRMPAVTGFLDYAVHDSFGGTDGWELVEVIQITSRDAFDHDNSTIGAALAAEWETWVADFRVLFLRDLLVP